MIRDEGDLSAAKEQLSVMSKAKVSLLDIVTKAAKDHPGTVLAAVPELKDGKPVCGIRIVKDGKVSRYDYDVVAGNEGK